MSDKLIAFSGIDRDRLIELGTATLGESGGIPLSPGIRPIWPGAAFASPALTVSCPAGDNLAVHAAVAAGGRGRVLAVAVAGSVARGYWGEVLTTAAKSVGFEALVIDGTVRDTAALARLSFPVFARGCALPGASKSGPGSVGKPVTIGDVLVHSDDWLIGDGDGVVLIRANQIDDCIAAAERRATHEVGMLKSLVAGATTVELLGLDVSSIERG